MSQINVDIVAPQTGTDVTISGNLIVTGTNNIKPYKSYVALLAQASPTSNPQAEVLENNLGVTITWARTAVGTYIATASSPLFIAAKTAVFMQVSATLGNDYPTQNITGRQSNTQIFVLTVKTDSVSTPRDASFGLTPIEIRVYN